MDYLYLNSNKENSLSSSQATHTHTKMKNKNEVFIQKNNDVQIYFIHKTKKENMYEKEMNEEEEESYNFSP